MSALCASSEAVPLRYVNALIAMVGEELFTIAQGEWEKHEHTRLRRNIEGWIFYPQLEERLPPEARATSETLRHRLALVEQYYAGRFGATSEIQQQRAREYIEKAKGT